MSKKIIGYKIWKYDYLLTNQDKHYGYCSELESHIPEEVLEKLGEPILEERIAVLDIWFDEVTRGVHTYKFKLNTKINTSWNVIKSALENVLNPTNQPEVSNTVSVWTWEDLKSLTTFICRKNIKNEIILIPNTIEEWAMQRKTESTPHPEVITKAILK